MLDIYRISEDYPNKEQYSLTSQIRRAALSIPSNIAEGSGKNSDNDFARFLNTARGSTSELNYQIFLANELGYFPDDTLKELKEDVEELKRMLTGFINALDESN